MIADQAADELLFDLRDGIGRVTFNRPRFRNALTFPMYQRLTEICGRADSEPAIKVLILSGAGDAFASGTDINQFRAFKEPQDALNYDAYLDRVLQQLGQCRVPTIAAISGACTGAGAAIAASCDLRVGTATMKFGFPIARTLGNCLSFHVLDLLSSLIGPARVKDIIFTARLIGTEEAAKIGLLTQAVEDVAALQRRVDQLALLIAGHAPLTLRATKEALRRLQAQNSLKTDDDLVLSCYQSHDFREGMDAFLNKRQPIWTGE